MSAGSRFAVAVHTLAVLGYLQKQGVEKACSRQIAYSVNTNPVVIRNLLRSLKKAGLVHSKEGRDGGVSLAKAASKISLHEIYVAVGETRVLSPHNNPEFKPCPVSRGMKRLLPNLFGEIDRVVEKALRARTLDEILDQL